MGASNSLFSISEVQGDAEFISYLEDLDSYQTPLAEYEELDARNPTLNEVYQSLEKAGIQILNERLEKDEIKLKQGEDITIHIFDITDKEIDYGEDLTLRYNTKQAPDEPIYSIGGIKTHYRILIKLAVELTKFCGSLYILNPYESFFIKKGQNYKKICDDINNKSS